MIYKVLLDGVGIYESDNNVVIIEPSLSIELNAAGNFEFTMPPSHDYYNHVNPLKSFVEVFEADTSIFYGRVSPHIEINWNNNKKVYCEGMLSFFNDSIQRPYEWESVSLLEFFQTLVSRHNEQVDSDIQFTIGNVTMDDIMVYKKTDYESTLDCIESMCIDAHGGFIMCRRVNGVNYIDWYKSVPYTGSQPVQFGMNLLDLTQIINNENFCTVIIPLGAEDEETGRKITVSSVNNGYDYIASDAVSTYGRITQVVEFNSISDPEDLLLAAQMYLERIQFEELTIECSAAELHHLNDEYSQFLLGQYVHVTSTPHLLNTDLPIVKMELNLDQAGKQITIGTLDKNELTTVVNNGVSYSGGSGSNNSGTDEHGGSGGDSGGISGQVIQFDSTPTPGSNNAVTSSGIYSALGPLSFSLNQDRTIHISLRSVVD